jgi:hypothetical protein
MRRLVLILVACASGLANTLSTSVTCDGVTYYGSGSTSCGDAGATASADSGDLFVDAFVSSLTGGYSSASASFSGEYVLTVMGGSGDGFADPLLSAGGDSFGAEDVASSSASLGGSSGGCQATGGPLPPYSSSTCTPTSLSFVFGIPQTLDISLSANATSGFDYDDPGVEGSAGAGGFSFYDVNGNPLPNATYTLVPFTPTPEPDMFPLLAVMACAAAARLYRCDRFAPAVCGKYRSRCARSR